MKKRTRKEGRKEGRKNSPIHRDVKELSRIEIHNDPCSFKATKARARACRTYMNLGIGSLRLIKARFSVKLAKGRDRLVIFSYFINI